MNLNKFANKISYHVLLIPVFLGIGSVFLLAKNTDLVQAISGIKEDIYETKISLLSHQEGLSRAEFIINVSYYL